MLGNVREDGHTIRQDLEEAAAYEQQLLLAAGNPDRERTGFEYRHQRRMVRKHAELAIAPIRDHEVHIALEQAPLDAHDSQRKRHYAAPFFFISSPCSRASSMVPTM